MKTSLQFFWLLVFFCLFTFARSAQALDLRTQLVADKVFAEYSKLSTPAQLLQVFATEKSPSEKAVFLQKLSSLHRLPKMIQTENGFSMPGESFPLEIDLRHGLQGQFLLNGVSISVDPKLPLMMQTEIAVRKLKESGQWSKAKKHVWFSLLVPEAHAQAALVAEMVKFAKVGALMAVAGKIVDRYGNTFLELVEKGVCYVTVDRDKYNAAPDSIPKDPNWCRDYWNAKRNLLKENAELAKKAPETEAFKVAMKTAQDGWKYGTMMDQCPQKKEDGSWEPYRGFLRVIYEPKEDKKLQGKINKSQKPEEYWVNVSANYDGNKLTGMTVYLDGNQSAPVSYTLDSQSVFTNFTMPTTDEYKGKEYSKAGSLEVPAAGDISDPWLKKRQTLHQKIFAFTSGNITTCIKNANDQVTLPHAASAQVKSAK